MSHTYNCGVTLIKEEEKRKKDNKESIKFSTKFVLYSPFLNRYAWAGTDQIYTKYIDSYKTFYLMVWD